VKKFSAIALAVVIAAVLYLTSLSNYLLFHNLVELFSLVIAFGIFMIAWNSRKFIDNNYLLFLGITCFFVGIFDVCHMLAYKGMNIFPEAGVNLSTQLWIAGRYLQGASLFAAPFFIDRRLGRSAVLITYTVVSALLLICIFNGIFPLSFGETSGSTRFKVISEYLVIILVILSVVILLRHRERFDRRVLRFITGSIVCIAFSEMALTLSVDVYGIGNLVGHYFKLASYYLLYRAMIKTGLKEPYSIILHDLQQSEERLLAAKNRAETYLNMAGTLFVIIDSLERIILINRQGCEILGCDKNEVIGSNWFETFIPPAERKEERAFFSQFLTGRSRAIEHRESAVVAGGDRERTIAWHYTMLNDDPADAVVVIASGEDITSRLEYEHALEKYQGKLEKLVQLRTGELKKTNDQLMLVSKKLSEAENIERRKIARELHDLVGQNLTALGLNMNIMKARLSSRDMAGIDKRIEDSISLIEETSVTIRDVMAKLRPPILDDYGLFAAIRSYTENFSDRTGIAVAITGEDFGTRLFRIAQEILNNVAKHSGAMNVVIEVSQNVSGISLVIADDGKGFDRDEVLRSKKKVRWGLTNIMERALSIGGTCAIESEPGKGTRIRVEVRT
jgi:PAS domain S-box-containing protein